MSTPSAMAVIWVSIGLWIEQSMDKQLEDAVTCQRLPTWLSLLESRAVKIDLAACQYAA